MLGLPPNLLGSYLYGTQTHGQPIVGNIVILKLGRYVGEPGVVHWVSDKERKPTS